MKSVFVVQSKMLGTICAANTKEKAKSFAKMFVDYMCWNCKTEIVYHEASWELANGERVIVEEVPVFVSQGVFAKMYYMPKWKK